jgi:hypothetical protein
MLQARVMLPVSLWPAKKKKIALSSFSRAVLAKELAVLRGDEQFFGSLLLYRPPSHVTALTICTIDKKTKLGSQL